MALLDQHGENIETAVGRFFDPNELISNALQSDLASLVSDCRAQKNPTLREMLKYPIEQITEELQGVLLGYEGHLIMTGLSRQTARLRGYDITEFTDSQEQVLCIPNSRITALQVNSNWYGTGFDVRPVVDLRIRTDDDLATVVGINKARDDWSKFTHEETTDFVRDGSWHQLVLGSGVIHLAT